MILKRIGLLLAAIGVVAFGFAAPAAAQYPPSAATVVISDNNPPAGGTITVTVQGCQAGENVRISLPPVVPVTVVCSSGGVASASLTMPLAGGTYDGTVELLGSEVTLPFQVTVTAPTGGGLPATGSDGTQNTLWYGAGVLVLGAGLLGVTRVRRRQTRLA